MTFSTLLVHDVTIVRPGTTTDRYGNTVKDWDNPASATATKGWVSQRSTEEDRDHREAEVSGWVLFLGPDETIAHEDRVTWGTFTFEVDGPPDPAWSPRGLHHYEAQLRVVTG